MNHEATQTSSFTTSFSLYPTIVASSMASDKVAEGQGNGTVEMVELKGQLNQNRLAPAQAMSEEEFLDAEKKLKRKLDIRLLACVWLIFVLNYLDRVSRRVPDHHWIALFLADF